LTFKINLESYQVLKLILNEFLDRNVIINACSLHFSLINFINGKILLNITKINEIIRIDWFEKLNILLLSRNIVLWQSLTLKNAKMIFIWKQSKTQTCGSCLQDFKWLQTVPFKSTAGRIPKRYECNEQNGVDFQYIGSRETIYVVKIFRVNTCCSFRNTYSFPSIGYSDWSVQFSLDDLLAVEIILHIMYLISLQ